MKSLINRWATWVATKIAPETSPVAAAIKELRDGDAPAKLRLLADLHDLRIEAELAERRVAAKGADRGVQADLRRWADAIERIIG